MTNKCYYAIINISKIKEKNMENLIKLENFKFEPRAITAIFDKFYFEVKGNFSEEELEKARNEIMIVITVFRNESSPLW